MYVLFMFYVCFFGMFDVCFMYVLSLFYVCFAASALEHRSLLITSVQHFDGKTQTPTLFGCYYGFFRPKKKHKQK